MDSERFDAVARTLGNGASRRGMLALLAGMAGLGMAESRAQQVKDVTVKVCHRRPNGDVVKLSVDPEEVSEHLDHGDFLPAARDGCCTNADCKGNERCIVAAAKKTATCRRPAGGSGSAPFCQGKPNGTVCAGEKQEDTRRCCNGVCANPDCRPAGTPCIDRGCAERCCSEYAACSIRRDPPCICGKSGSQFSRSCGTDIDCGDGICVCGQCCLQAGERLPEDYSCLACCSGSCKGGQPDVCA